MSGPTDVTFVDVHVDIHYELVNVLFVRKGCVKYVRGHVLYVIKNDVHNVVSKSISPIWYGTHCAEVMKEIQFV